MGETDARCGGDFGGVSGRYGRNEHMLYGRNGAAAHLSEQWGVSGRYGRNEHVLYGQNGTCQSSW